MRTDEFDATTGKTFAKPVRIGGLAIQQPCRFLLRKPHIDECLNCVHFGVICGKSEDGERFSIAVDQQHDLRALAPLGFAYVGAPFFAGANVPSAIASSQLIRPTASSFLISRRIAFSQTPASDHSFKRRQHVAGLGYRSGKSCHRAPVFSIHKTPSRHSLAGTRGRPPSSDLGGSCSRSRSRTHCESDTNGFGAVLDPVVFGRRLGGHFDREMTM